MAYLEDAVIIRGYVARVAAVGLRALDRDGYFNGIGLHDRLELRAVIAELERAGRAWHERAAAETLERNNETRPRETIAHSPLSARQAADLLQLTPRRIQQIAESIGGVKQRGRWLFDRAAVLAEAERRREREWTSQDYRPASGGTA